MYLNKNYFFRKQITLQISLFLDLEALSKQGNLLFRRPLQLVLAPSALV